MKKSILILGVLALISCSATKTQQTDFNYKEIGKISDSITIQNITILNLFKSQILAHKNSKFDSAMIVKQVYFPHKKLWDSCYAQIFGDQNAKLFNTEKGMIGWNRTLFDKGRTDFIAKTKSITDINVNKLLKTNLDKFNRLVPFQPSAKISLLFTPITGIGFGGCDSQQFAFEINNTSLDVLYTLEKGLPHELNHLVYEKFRNADADKNTALSQTIDEGFACYFTYVFFDEKIPEHEAVENMTKENWEWFVKHEKDIFIKTKPYFSDSSGNNPLLRNDRHKLFPEAPKTLNYWLGYRIVSQYVEKHGKHSWKDIYRLTPKEVLEKSGYEKYIEKL